MGLPVQRGESSTAQIVKNRLTRVLCVCTSCVVWVRVGLWVCGVDEGCIVSVWCMVCVNASLWVGGVGGGWCVVWEGRDLWCFWCVWCVVCWCEVWVRDGLLVCGVVWVRVGLWVCSVYEGFFVCMWCG